MSNTTIFAIQEEIEKCEKTFQQISVEYNVSVSFVNLVYSSITDSIEEEYCEWYEDTYDCE